MRSFSLNFSDWLLRDFVCITSWVAVLSMGCAGVSASTLCQKTPGAKRGALILLDSALRPIVGKVLQVGEVDFSVSREVDRQYFIVAPRRASPTTALGGVTMNSTLELVEKCPEKNVFALNVSFDSSQLPAGTFSEPLSVYEDSFGMSGAPIRAQIETVSGEIKRAWISAELEGGVRSSSGVMELRLKNVGNLKSAPLQFPPLSLAKSVRVGVNECQARVLAPGEPCVVELEPAARGVSDEVFDWPIDAGASSFLTLHFRRRHGGALQVEALNR